MSIHTEKHWGVITDNADPEMRGRIKAKCQSLVGADNELPTWIEPTGHLMAGNGSGALFLPEIGSTVELTMDSEDDDDDMRGECFLQNPNMRWRPAPASDQNGPMAIPAALLTDYPNTRGWVTKAGHMLIFNDKGGITIKGKDGGTITLDTDGSIKLSSPTLLGSASGVSGATDLMILGQAFMTLFNAHSHATGVGPSGPPLTLMTTAQLSQNGHKVG